MNLERGLEPFPGYRLVDFLGQGGWGQVWKADKGSQQVALKFLPCDSQQSASVEIRALQSIRALNHPNLLRIDAIWGFERWLVIAMELADASLLDLLETYYNEFGQGITPQHLCYFLSQAAVAIDYMNQRHHQVNQVRVAVRHCDVKPSNLLLQGENIKLADFSLAVPTTTNRCVHRRCGTLHYAAPEIFQGWISDRTDQYALAITYCELRSGRFPFHDTPNSFDKNYQRPKPDLSMLSPAEQPIIMKALHPVPQDRWPSCLEMMQALGRAF